jgi:hypothetical protein
VDATIVADVGDDRKGRVAIGKAFIGSDACFAYATDSGALLAAPD